MKTAKFTTRLANHLCNMLPKWKSLIDNSFLTDEAKADYLSIIESRIARVI